ncbi:MAG TPA: PQQ-binding-like beta-propeller repeat protein [Terriglobia bacterium]|nr:PQQ-binding-like beta-propeller repeat protein [Terriglobia bacterium]
MAARLSRSALRAASRHAIAVSGRTAFDPQLTPRNETVTVSGMKLAQFGLRRISALVILAGLAALAAAPAPGAQESQSVQIIPVDGEAGRYWTRWRGPSGQGLVSGGSYPDQWSDKENILWKTPLTGEGNSSPIVWRDRIFLTNASLDGKRLSVLAFRASDGARLWESAAPEGRVEFTRDKNGHASATPVTDGERIYVSFGSRGLMAFSLEGKLEWRRDLGPIDNYWGTAGSPLLYKDRVIVYQDQSRDSFIAAFNARTGDPLWRTRRSATVGWGTPVAIRAHGRDEIVVNGQNAVIAYDPTDGHELWRVNGTTVETIPTPVVAHGLIFSSSGRAGPTLAIRPGGEGDVTRTHVEWSSPRGSPFVPSPIAYGDHLYMVNDMTSIVTSFEAATGRSLWQSRLGAAQREGFSASPVAVEGKVFFTNDEGETFVLRAGSTFDLVRVNRIGEPTLASPALVGGRWYIRTTRHLLAIGK